MNVVQLSRSMVCPPTSFLHTRAILEYTLCNGTFQHKWLFMLRREWTRWRTTGYLVTHFILDVYLNIYFNYIGTAQLLFWWEFIPDLNRSWNQTKLVWVHTDLNGPFPKGPWVLRWTTDVCDSIQNATTTENLVFIRIEIIVLEKEEKF